MLLDKFKVRSVFLLAIAISLQFDCTVGFGGPTGLNHAPDVLISEIASFLDMHSLNHFQETSRLHRALIRPRIEIENQTEALHLIHPDSKETIQKILQNRKFILSHLVLKIHQEDLVVLDHFLLARGAAFDPTKVYLAFLMAEYAVNFEAASIAAREAGREASMDAARNFLNPEVQVEVSNLADQAEEVEIGIWKVTADLRIALTRAGFGGPLSAACAGRGSMRNSAKKATFGAVSQVLEKLTEDDLELSDLQSKEIRRIASAFSEMMTLVWLKERNAPHFKAAFYAAYQALDRFGDSKLEKGKKLLLQSLRERNLAKDPFVKRLKKILLEVNRRIS